MDVMTKTQLYWALNNARFIRKWGWSNLLTTCLGTSTCIMFFVQVTSLIHQGKYVSVTPPPSQHDAFSTSLLKCERNGTTGDYICYPTGNATKTLTVDAEVVEERRPEELDVEVTNYARKSLFWYNASNRKLLSRIKSEKYELPRKLITMFTTMKETREREFIHRNTLINWSTLSSWMDPVLFIPEFRSPDGWPTEAEKLGWKVKRTPYVIKNVPLLKWMFATVGEDGYDTPFVGYANADILFDSELMRTLLTILETHDDLEHTQIMIVGRRKNVNVHLIRNGACLTCLRNQAIGTQMYQPDAEDYFIISRAGFPWDMVPEFIVGWPGYDNWLVAQALRWGIAVVDASQTINAIHQSGSEGIRSGWDLNKDPYTNLRLVSPSFRFEMGKVNCAHWKSIYSFVGCPANQSYCVKMVQRHPLEIPPDCLPPTELETVTDLGSYQYDVMLAHDY